MNTTYDVIIIGAGPAGLTAALYAGRAGLKTLVIEKMGIGGRILTSEMIENYPGFPGGVTTQELMKRMEDQAREVSVTFEIDQVTGIDPDNKRIKTAAAEYIARAIIIATGAVARKLSVPGEERLTGRGVSYCATCDAPFYKNKKVIVTGGGNTVAEEALYLTRFASSVTILHRRNQMRASAILQERLKANPKINFLLETVILEINGAAKVESVKTRNVVSGAEGIVPCDGVFVYIGYDPDTSLFKGKIKLDEYGFIAAGENLATSCEGVFVCGDCRKKDLYQVITACAEGAVAADAAYKYISK
jgi:thioredoxin reductase (NADPH)